MKLVSARVRDYRSANDTGLFEVEPKKTILVGPNEAGKTVVLQALQMLNPPAGECVSLEPLHDYPRARYTEIEDGKVDPSHVVVAQGRFGVDEDDLLALREVEPSLDDCGDLVVERRLDNTLQWYLTGWPASVRYGDVEKDFARLRAHLAKKGTSHEIATALDQATANLTAASWITRGVGDQLSAWLDTVMPYVDEDDEREQARFGRLRAMTRRQQTADEIWSVLKQRLPVLVYFSHYFTVRPRINLASLAARQESGDIDKEYDFGNLCLLKLLGFTAKELSQLAAGAPPDQPPYNVPAPQHQAAIEAYQKQLDRRHYRLNAASVELTRMIRRVWGDQQVTLRIVADGQYLKVVVQDDLGVEVELDQRSEGFRWLVSFFVVFRAQARDELTNAILLLDEPGLSLHALKQQEFRKTVSLLADDNQVVYTTHSPFMVGTDELHLVRIVELADRETGTKVHTSLLADDPRSIYPLQAALGYELAQSLFAQRRNLVVEGVTDLFYVEAMSTAMRDAGLPCLREDRALVPAQSASKVIYYCTLLRGQRLKVAALLDSDQAGERAASQDDFVRLLKPKEILRTKDHYRGQVQGPEIEDLLRDTLVAVARDDLGWDVTAIAKAQPTRRIVDVFKAEVAAFSKYSLARAFLRWLGSHGVDDLPEHERDAWASLLGAADRALA